MPISGYDGMIEIFSKKEQEEKLKTKIDNKVKGQKTELIYELKAVMDSVAEEEYVKEFPKDKASRAIHCEEELFTVTEKNLHEEIEKLLAENERLKADLDDYIQQTEYWYRHYQSVVQQNEKLQMEMDKQAEQFDEMLKSEKGV